MRQPGQDLPLLATPLEVESMRAWHCKYRSFAALPEYERLEELVIATFPELSLEVIARLPRLRYLKIVHLPKVTSLLPLTRLNKLQCLSLATLPSWDSARRLTTVLALQPLAEMRSLRHLELMGVCPPDRSLSALYACKWLKTARFSQYPNATVEEFYAATGAANEFNPPSRFELDAE